MSISPTVTFAVGANIVTLPIPLRGLQVESSRSQNIHRTADGDLLVYDRSAAWKAAELAFEVTKAQRDALDTWFHTHAQGGSNAFTYTDPHGTAFSNCRFLDPELSFAKTPGARYSVALRFQVSALP